MDLFKSDRNSAIYKPETKASVSTTNEAPNEVWVAQQQYHNTPFPYKTYTVSYPDYIYKAVIPNWLFKPPFGIPTYKDVPEIRRMAKTPYIAMIINTIVDEITSIDWDVVAGEDEVIPDEILKKTKDWIYNPNRNEESIRDIMRMWIRDLLELDAGVIVKVYDMKGDMKEIYARDGATFLKDPDVYGVLPPPRENKTEQDATKFAYWQYGWSTNARPIGFYRDEIVYLIRNQRTDSQYGLSPVEACLDIVQMLLYGLDMNLAYYNDNYVPKGVFTMQGATGEDIRRFTEGFQQAMKTYDKAGDKWRRNFHKMPVINTEGKFERIQFSNLELEFIQQHEFFLKIVNANFGITPSELGFTEDVNKATSYVQSATFKRKAIRPLLDLIEYPFNEQIINELPWIKGKYEDKVFFRFDRYDLGEEVEKRKVVWGDYKEGIITKNEARAELELEPMADGDEVKQQGGMFGGEQFGNPMNKMEKTAEEGKPDEEGDKKETEGKALTTNSNVKLFPFEEPAKPEKLAKEFKKKNFKSRKANKTNFKGRRPRGYS